MSQLQCLYCGADIPSDAERCPQCDAPSHFRSGKGRYSARRTRFLILFALVVVGSIALALLLPR